MTAGQEPTLEHAMETIREGLREEKAALAAIPDSQEAFDQAAEFHKTATEEVRVTTMNTRDQQAQRIWDDEEVGERSLAKLAAKTNVTTKEGARKMLLRAQAAEEACQT